MPYSCIGKEYRDYWEGKGPSSQSYSFSSSHVWMWELDYKESWAPNNWCFWTVVVEKTLESPLDCKEIRPVNLRGNQPWIFIGRTDAEGEALILWPPGVKSWLIGTDPEAGKDWRWEKGMTGWGGWMASPTQWIWLSWLQELMMDREAWRAPCCHEVAKGRTWLRDRTELNRKEAEAYQ